MTTQITTYGAGEYVVAPKPVIHGRHFLEKSGVVPDHLLKLQSFQETDDGFFKVLETALGLRYFVEVLAGNHLAIVRIRRAGIWDWIRTAGKLRPGREFICGPAICRTGI